MLGTCRENETFPRQLLHTSGSSTSEDDNRDWEQKMERVGSSAEDWSGVTLRGSDWVWMMMSTVLPLPDCACSRNTRSLLDDPREEWMFCKILHNSMTDNGSMIRNQAFAGIV